MTSPAIEHATFVIERELPASPRDAYRFWSEPRLKQRWTSCHPDWTVLEDRHDFRADGSESKRWRTPEGAEQTYRAAYLDVVPGERIIYAYEMGFRGQRISASLVTVEFVPSGAGTLMRFTEQAALLDGSGAQGRRMGTEAGLDRLAEMVRAGVAELH
ncbi:MAG: SRPBCC family protein [Achromobacter sp.]|uniref:SRPBCC family protein n=1 Tax=Achromobacter sp. TaxID=134375 RepID=UPI003D009FEF